MMNTEDTIPPTKIPRRRRRWLLPVALFLMGMIVVGVCISRIETRRLVVGKTDPATGFRYRFTVARGWKDDPDFKNKPVFAFNVPDPSAFQVWIENNLFPHTNSGTGFVFEPKLWVGVMSESMLDSFELRDGYPTFLYSEKSSSRVPSPIIEQKHLLISGQPAAWLIVRESAPSGAPGITSPPVHDYIYTIKVRDQPLWYYIHGRTDEDHKDQMRREVQAIGESFRIEQVSGAVRR